MLTSLLVAAYQLLPPLLAANQQVLQEALINEDDARHAPTVDELGPEAAVLLEELRERQAMMSSGQWDPERNFDDFRLVLGDAML